MAWAPTGSIRGPQGPAGPAGAGVPPGPSPGSLLNIGPDINGRVGQNHFAVQVARDGDTAVTTKSTTDIAAGYAEDPYFVLNTAKKAVQLRASVGGPTTDGSNYARCELREQDGTGNNYGFDATAGTHVFHGRSKITHAPATTPDIVLAQLFNGSVDRVAFRTQKVSTSWRLRLRVNGTSVTTTVGLDIRTGIDNIQNIEFEWKIEIIAGQVKFYLDDMVTPIYTSAAGVLASTGGPTWYFKTGCYLQTTPAVDAAGDYGAVELRDLWHTHPGWPAPATFYAVPQHAATHAPGGQDDLSGIYQALAAKDQPGGYLGLDANGIVPTTKQYGATPSSYGIIALAGDLGGTAAAPTVPGLAGKLDDNDITFFREMLRPPISRWGLAAATMHPYDIWNSGIAFGADAVGAAAAVVLGFRCVVPKNTPINSLVASVAVAGAGSAGVGKNGFAVYEINGTTLNLAGATPNDATIWTAANWRRKALSAPVAAQPVDREVFLLLAVSLAAGGTSPSLRYRPLMSSTFVNNRADNDAVVPHAFYLTGQTSNAWPSTINAATASKDNEVVLIGAF